MQGHSEDIVSQEAPDDNGPSSGSTASHTAEEENASGVNSGIRHRPNHIIFATRRVLIAIQNQLVRNLHEARKARSDAPGLSSVE